MAESQETILLPELKHVERDCDSLLRICGILISGLANLVSRLAFGEKILFDRL